MMGHNCIGPMGRFVEDLELLLPVIAGADDADPYAVPVPVGDPRSVKIAGLRVRFYAYDGLAPVTDGTRRAVELAATTLADAGALVEEAAPPQVADATELFFTSMAADGGARARADLRFGERPMDPALESLLRDLSENALDAGSYFDLQRRIFELRRRFREFMRDVDVLLCPVTAGCAPPHGHWPGESAGSNSFEAFNYTFLISLVGLPSAVVPIGEEEGMPIGVQIVARAFHDHVSLAAARVLEQTLGGFAAVQARQSASAG
jgi:amidase